MSKNNCQEIKEDAFLWCSCWWVLVMEDLLVECKASELRKHIVCTATSRVYCVSHNCCELLCFLVFFPAAPVDLSCKELVDSPPSLCTGPYDWSLLSQKISIKIKQTNKLIFAHLATFANKCVSCLKIIKSCYLDYRVNKPFTSSRCSCPVHVIPYYVRKGWQAFYLITHKWMGPENAIIWEWGSEFQLTRFLK